MPTLKFMDKTISVTDYHIVDDIISVDFQLNFVHFMNDIYPLISEKNEDHFNFSLDANEFYGRFGNFYYDQNGNVRLYLVNGTKFDDEYDPKALSSMVLTENMAEYHNALLLLNDYNDKINGLISLLRSKGILNDEEYSFENVLSSQQKNIDIKHEVFDLNDFLKKTHSTLNEIKNESDD